MKPNRWLSVILLLGLLLRLAYALPLDPLEPFAPASSDTRLYLLHGDALINNAQIEGIDLSILAQPPVYYIITGIPQAFLSPEGTVIVIRILQAILSVATAYCAYRIARRIANERAGVGAAALIALNPIFIIESAFILTETVYIFWLALGFMVYLEAVAETPPRMPSFAWTGGVQAASRLRLPRNSEEGRYGGAVDSVLFSWQLFALAGAIFGLATLTRAVLLAFPLGLALHLLLVYRGQAWRKIVALLIAYALVVSTWTLYNLVRWDRFIIAGQGLPAFLYVGAAGWADPEAVDAGLNEDLGRPASDDPAVRQGDYVEAAGSSISADPLGYLRRRITELAGAYLQPHGTTYFGGESLRELTAVWWREDRTLAGIGRVISGEQFAPKLLLYIFHFGVLILGGIGAWRTRRRWWLTLPLLGFIAYVTLVHFFLLALPRYIFPTMLCWIVLAASGLTLTAKHKYTELKVES
ncbi:MAG: phospholipid carrier-dependent glycosyltransferase [Anaerolinea sp.]|nr:phospholipid carrier-dependent glycosyltransferase [Anaerolinea sp.]